MRQEITPVKKIIRQSPELQKLRKKRRTGRRKIAVIVSAFVLVLLAGFVLASRIPKIRITHILVSGNQVVDTEDITQHAQAILSGYFAYVIPKNNAFLYEKKQLLADLSSSFPRLTTIEIGRSNLTALTITVTEGKGAALWCGDDSTAGSRTQCYFADESAHLIDIAPYYSGDVYLRFYGSPLLAAGESVLGKQFVSPEEFVKLRVFADRCKLLGLPVRAVHLGETEDTFILSTGASGAAVIRFNAGDNYPTLAENLSLAISKDQLKNDLAEDAQNLQYFDLRFTNKVYYKFSDK